MRFKKLGIREEASLFANVWPGSFQNTSIAMESEDPLEEVWAQVSRFATDEALAKLKPTTQGINWQKQVGYLQVRVLQALEFRKAAHDSTMLTAPLPLYYSFLNLMRAYLAQVPEIMPKPFHGLREIKNPKSLLEAGASICEGTFTDYLDATGQKWKTGESITLSDALGCVVEMHVDLLEHDQNLCNVQQVVVEGWIGGPTKLLFPMYPADEFGSNWKLEFPQFTDCAALVPGEAALQLNVETTGRSYADVSQFLYTKLYNNLTVVNAPIWWTLRHTRQKLKLDRIALYHVITFILGSVVRYKPELLSEAAHPASGVGWLVRRFLKRAERYYPQLMLMFALQGGGQVYF